MAQFYREKFESPHEKESVLEEDKICSAIDTDWDNIQVTFPGDIIVECALMQMRKTTDIFVFTFKKIYSQCPML